MALAICPGSFDPVTHGHLDIIERTARMFDQVMVVVPRNTSKQPWFTVEERMEMLREVISHLPNVTVDATAGLTVEFARSVGATVLVKGLRAVQDFEYEFQQAMVNKKLAPDLDTIFMMTRDKYSFISSSIVREVATHGGTLEGMVPELVAQRLRAKAQSRNQSGR